MGDADLVLNVITTLSELETMDERWEQTDRLIDQVDDLGNSEETHRAIIPYLSDIYHALLQVQRAELQVEDATDELINFLDNPPDAT